jgi:DNA modification methylase
MNQLILGDNLDVLRKMDSESVDLIYLDPPFFSNRNYEVIWGDEGEIRSFRDRWSGGIDHYIAWLKERVIEMHRILKSTGSIFLHCDWHANSHIRVFILDKVFGEQNLRNEIIWYYRRWTNVSKQFQNMHDTIFWYSKSNKYPFNKNGFKPSLSQLKKFEKGWDQNVVKDGKGNKITQYIIYNKEKFEKNCKPIKDARLVYRETNELKVAPPDVLEIPIINSQSHERIGYPTQKPEELLHKLIFTTTNEGDTVLDPFVGGGTTIAVADKLNRNWIGVDQSVQAIKVAEMRLQNQHNLLSQPFIIQLHKYDYDTLRNKQAFAFETWIIEQYGGTANTKQRSDLGLDGKTLENTPIQVKRSDNIGRNVIDNFKSACERYDKNLYNKNIAENKIVGIIIAFSFGRGAIQEVARLKNQENVKIELVTVADIVPIAKKPTLTIKFNDLGTDNKNLREIEFIATAESESGIEFYAWNFNYNAEKGFLAEILLDKEGKQRYKFLAGSHSIAVKVIDNEGLENIEIIKLKVNGKIEIK